MDSSSLINNWVNFYIGKKLRPYFFNHLEDDYGFAVWGSKSLQKHINEYKRIIKYVHKNFGADNELDPRERWAITHTERNVKNAEACLSKAKPTDMFKVHPNFIDDTPECKIFDKTLLMMFAYSIDSYLQYLAPITFKIKWILKHKPMSDSKFAKKVHLYQQQVNYYRRGKRDILRMSLKTALNFSNFYDKYIDGQVGVKIAHSFS